MLERFLQHGSHHLGVQDRLISGERAPGPELRRSEYGQVLAILHCQAAPGATPSSVSLVSNMRDACQSMERELDSILLAVTGREYQQ